MTDLLVWSLMADGGLETAIFDALRAEIVELAEIDETFDTPTTHTTIPLLHLVKQLLRYFLLPRNFQVCCRRWLYLLMSYRNGSSLTQMRLQELKTSCKVNHVKGTTTPSSNLLMRFQRLLIGKIYARDSNCLQAAESLLKKYLHQIGTHVTETLNLAHEVAMVNPKNFMHVVQILKGDVVGKFNCCN